MATADLNGVRLYYEIHGSGEPLFLTHGSWGDATAWQSVVPDLAGRFRVVVWDRRGHSRSSAGDGVGSFRQDAEDLASLIEYLDAAGAHVHGASAGGIVVLTMAGIRPELITTIAVHEPPVLDLLPAGPDPGLARGLADQRARLDRVRELIDAGDRRAGARLFFDDVAVGPGAWEHFSEAVRRTFEANATTYADELSVPGAWYVEPATVPAGEVPTLITLGTESPPLIRAATRELARQIPAARVETLQGAGHVPYRTHPDLWLAALLRHLESSATGRDAPGESDSEAPSRSGG